MGDDLGVSLIGLEVLIADVEYRTAAGETAVWKAMASDDRRPVKRWAEGR
ncbi:hypothetical protein ACFTZB_40810 [Rhodococcus sp. NPDC057014]